MEKDLELLKKQMDGEFEESKKVEKKEKRVEKVNSVITDINELRKNALSEFQVAVYSLVETFVATAIAFVVGYLVIAWLLKFVTTKSFAPFIIYRVILGSVLLVLLAFGVLQP